MQLFFYLKPQGHQIWAYNYLKICRFLLTFSILRYLIGFICIQQCRNPFCVYILLSRSFRLVPMFSGSTHIHIWNKIICIKTTCFPFQKIYQLQIMEIQGYRQKRRLTYANRNNICSSIYRILQNLHTKPKWLWAM